MDRQERIERIIFNPSLIPVDDDFIWKSSSVNFNFRPGLTFKRIRISLRKYVYLLVIIIKIKNVIIKQSFKKNK